MYDEKLVTDNLALAKYVAKKYIQSGLEYDDLLQVAYEGLVLAAARYDPGKGFAFSTFAVCCMEKRIWMQFRKKGVDTESLEDPIPGTDLVLADTLEDPTDAFAEMALRDVLVWAIGRLRPRERYVIEAQFLRDPPMTQREIARVLGTQQAYVSRIRKQALEKLRAYMGGQNKL